MAVCASCSASTPAWQAPCTQLGSGFSIKGGPHARCLPSLHLLFETDLRPTSPTASGAAVHDPRVRPLPARTYRACAGIADAAAGPRLLMCMDALARSSLLAVGLRQGRAAYIYIMPTPASRCWRLPTLGGVHFVCGNTLFASSS